ncbi:hypothetical protein ACTFIV_001766 [Dictyostelium citrinum]
MLILKNAHLILKNDLILYPVSLVVDAPQKTRDQLKVKFSDPLKGKKVMIGLLSMDDSKYTGYTDITFGDQREARVFQLYYSEKESGMTFTNKKLTINTSQTLVIRHDIKPIKKYDSIIVYHLFGKVLFVEFIISPKEKKKIK